MYSTCEPTRPGWAWLEGFWGLLEDDILDFWTVWWDAVFLLQDALLECFNCFTLSMWTGNYERQEDADWKAFVRPVEDKVARDNGVLYIRPR